MNVLLISLKMVGSIRRYLVLLMLAVLSSAAYSDTFTFPEVEENRPDGFTLTPMFGNLKLDDDRGLDDSSFVSFALGYRSRHPYDIEFVYLGGDSDTTAGASNGDLRQFRLEALYDLNNSDTWKPYLSFGAASTEFGNANSQDEGAMVLGFGTRYHFTERVALRADARYLKGVGDVKGADYLFAIGLNIFLGELNKPAPVVVAEPVVQQTQPEPEKPSLAELCAQAGGVLNGSECLKTSTKTERVQLNVQFEYNSEKVRDSYLPEVEVLADFMKTYPTATVVIEGHTDSTGSDAYNQALSQRRVNEVARLLSTDYGIDAGRMSAIGYGETQPLAPNDTDANRAKNRRVVASITVELEETIELDVE